MATVVISPMNNLAVLKYEFETAKPEGIPDEWPSRVVELGEGTELPGEDWVLMTRQELIDHRAEWQDEYNTWWESYRAQEEEANPE